MKRYICPIDGCTSTFDDPESLAGHVASKAPDDEDHWQQRESPNHKLEWYEENCEDENQNTLF